MSSFWFLKNLTKNYGGNLIPEIVMIRSINAILELKEPIH